MYSKRLVIPFSFLLRYMMYTTAIIKPINKRAENAPSTMIASTTITSSSSSFYGWNEIYHYDIQNGTFL